MYSSDTNKYALNPIHHKEKTARIIIQGLKSNKFSGQLVSVRLGTYGTSNLINNREHQSSRFRMAKCHCLLLKL